MIIDTLKSKYSRNNNEKLKNVVKLISSFPITDLYHKENHNEYRIRSVMLARHDEFIHLHLPQLPHPAAKSSFKRYPKHGKLNENNVST